MMKYGVRLVKGHECIAYIAFDVFVCEILNWKRSRSQSRARFEFCSEPFAIFMYEMNQLCNVYVAKEKVCRTHTYFKQLCQFTDSCSILHSGVPC